MFFPSFVAAQTIAPPDVVRLRDGTFLRGTLVERSPTQVVLMLPTGETRTYPAELVTFAGPDTPPAPAAASTPPAAPVAQVDRIAMLHVRTDQPALSLQRLQGTTTVSVMVGSRMDTAQVDQFGVVCNAPCDIEMPEGAYQLGVARGADQARRVGPPIDLRGDMTLRVGYTNRWPLRRTGWLIFGIGGAIGVGLMVGSIWAGPSEPSVWDGSPEPTTSPEMLISGGIVFLASTVIAALFVFRQDHPTLEIDGSGVRF